jgi:mannonate dehydratase
MVGLAGAAILGLAAARLGVPWLFRRSVPRPLGPRAREFVERCFEGLDRARVWDAHVHLVGLGAGGSGCRIHPSMQSHRHPLLRLQYDVYRAAVGMRRKETADQDYVQGLLRQQQAANPSGKLLLLALDDVVDEDGTERPELTPMFTPGDYALRLAHEHPQLAAAVSIHPYRRDAVARLERAAEAGARAVKWIPNAMVIDPAAPRCDPFYRRIAALDLPLIVHTGKEYAMPVGEHQPLGDPLRLERALDHGVRVVASHAGGPGSFPDAAAPRGKVASLDLFLRLFDDPQWEGRLYADISAITQINYPLRTARELLARPGSHHRLLFGSDYPLPAIRFLTPTRRLERAGLLDRTARARCDEVFAANPLLFDFVLKRSLRLERGGRTERFAPGVFETARVLA